MEPKQGDTFFSSRHSQYNEHQSLFTISTTSLYHQVPKFAQRRRRPVSSTTHLTSWWKWATLPHSPAGRMATRSPPLNGCATANPWRRRRQTASCSPWFCQKVASSSWAWEVASEVSRMRASTPAWPGTARGKRRAVTLPCIFQVRLWHVCTLYTARVCSATEHFQGRERQTWSNCINALCKSQYILAPLKQTK